MFLTHIHNFRAYAIIGIVGVHCLDAFQWNQHPYVYRFFDTLFIQSSILFIFIAGFMFQYLSPRFEKWDYWGKKLRNVIVPYLLLSIPAIYYYTQLAHQDDTWAGFYDNPLYQQVFYFIITGNQLAPFWIVPTIAVFYMLAPFLIKADRDRRIYYFLPVFCLISLFLGRDGSYGPLTRAAYLFSVYLFGMYASIYHDEILNLVRRYRVALLGLFIGLFYANFLFQEYDQYLQYMLKLLMCPMLLYFFDRADDFLGGKFDYLAHISFGIFFVHAYVLPAIKILYLEMSGSADFPEGSFASYIILTMSVVLGCMVIIWLGQKLTGKYSRMLLGS